MSKRYARKLNIREIKEKILIVCEGKKTEPNYFKAFPVNVQVVDIDVKGCGYNTLSLVEEAIKRKESAERDEIPYNQVWCVFDKDDFSDNIFNKAIFEAERNKIKVAWSNEAFELWYLLHFIPLEAKIGRTEYREKLTERLGFQYKKNSINMYKKLIDKQKDAIVRAGKLLKIHLENQNRGNDSFVKLNAAKANPSTKVHLLVLELNKFLKNNKCS